MIKMNEYKPFTICKMTYCRHNKLQKSVPQKMMFFQTNTGPAEIMETYSLQTHKTLSVKLRAFFGADEGTRTPTPFGIRS